MMSVLVIMIVMMVVFMFSAVGMVCTHSFLPFPFPGRGISSAPVVIDGFHTTNISPHRGFHSVRRNEFF
jgi:hypothetical protein